MLEVKKSVQHFDFSVRLISVGSGQSLEIGAIMVNLRLLCLASRSRFVGPELSLSLLFSPCLLLFSILLLLILSFYFTSTRYSRGSQE